MSPPRNDECNNNIHSSNTNMNHNNSSSKAADENDDYFDMNSLELTPKTTTTITKPNSKERKTKRRRSKNASEYNNNNNYHYESNQNSNEENDTDGLFVDDTNHNERKKNHENEQLLGIAFVSFTLFGIAQMIVAVYIAKSQAMIGDSAAMFVDSLTYLVNYMAEKQKQNLMSSSTNSTSMTSSRMESPTTADSSCSTSATNQQVSEEEPGAPIQQRQRIEQQQQQQRIQQQQQQRKYVLQLEIIPPMISVTTLIIITAVVTKQAVKVLWRDTNVHYHQSLPNIHLMLGFSVVNLLLDLMNVFCFAKAKHLCGYSTTVVITTTETTAIIAADRMDGSNDDAAGIGITTGISCARMQENEREMDSSATQKEYDGDNDDEELECSDDELEYSGNDKHTTASNHPSSKEEETANLNMCSAYTHVFADTLRSLAVIAAASCAMIFPVRVTPEEADATAAIIVSILILLSLIPLFHGLYNSIYELVGILQDEKKCQLQQQQQQVELVVLEEKVPKQQEQQLLLYSGGGAGVGGGVPHDGTAELTITKATTATASAKASIAIPTSSSSITKLMNNQNDPVNAAALTAASATVVALDHSGIDEITHTTNSKNDNHPHEIV